MGRPGRTCAEAAQHWPSQVTGDSLSVGTLNRCPIIAPEALSTPPHWSLGLRSFAASGEEGVCAASSPWNRQPVRSGPPHSRPSPPTPAACLSASLPARAPRKVLYFSDEGGTAVPEPAAPCTLPAPALGLEVEPQGLETILTSALSQYGRKKQTRREPGTCPSSAARRPDQGTAASLGGERPAGSWRSRELSPCPVQPWMAVTDATLLTPRQKEVRPSLCGAGAGDKPPGERRRSSRSSLGSLRLPAGLSWK
ncbi:uncharacterized protein [Callorhinus ursinus]|uniref:uncharacterized protein isoform X1 n=1 Tax=Callorhinus ursinus TaxID=34884 RepID=UPI003CD04F1D